ncbi:MAG TPA: response regulator, partial [Candidatus Acidoferrales bacterium]|nr:response regulator [Candidatus Acidoferrales bacterium]
MKILVADDNRSIAKKVDEALKPQGCEILGVTHGEAAVKKLADFMPDLVLADVFMPVRNGYEVCEFVKNDQRFAHIPVVLLIGAFDPIDQHEVQRVHADGLLKKPFDPPDDLLQMVKTMLEKSAHARAETVAKAIGSKVSDTVELTAGEMKEIAEAKAPEAEAEEFSVRPARIEFGEGSEALSFGELMETPAEGEAPKVVEKEGPQTAESGFRASSVPEIEPAGTEESAVEEPAATAEAPSWSAMEPAPAAEESSAPEAPPEMPQWGGVEVPAKEPSPDEPPIKVEFDSSEPLELVTDETPAAPSLVESGPLPELAASPNDFMTTPAPSAAPETPPEQPEQEEAAEIELEPFAIPSMEEVPAPAAEEPVAAA